MAKKSLFNEFKEFAFKGNVIDMAVGVVIGGAFGSIVSSLVNDIIMPLVGLLTGDTSFADLQIVLKSHTETVEGVETLVVDNAVRYGQLIQYILNFFIIAICIFAVVKLLNRGKEKRATAEAEAAAKKAAEEAEAAANAPKEPTEKELLAELVEIMKNK